MPRRRANPADILVDPVLCGGFDPEVLRTEDEIRQRVAVERLDECRESFLKYALQAAARRDQTIVLRGKALDQGEVGLGGANDVTQPDLVRTSCQRQSARGSP